ncbi:MAG: GHKL domain-containing protein [Oscillospiraceae bacterium]|nr:GHKL domain-containing protein [Oscillospiraceae bacterium]
MWPEPTLQNIIGMLCLCALTAYACARNCRFSQRPWLWALAAFASQTALQIAAMFVRRTHTAEIALMLAGMSALALVFRFAGRCSWTDAALLCIITDMEISIGQPVVSLISRLIGKTQWAFRSTAPADVPWNALNMLIFAALTVEVVEYTVRTFGPAGMNLRSKLLLIAFFGAANCLSDIAAVYARGAAREVALLMLVIEALAAAGAVLAVALARVSRMRAQRDGLQELVQQQYDYYDAMQEYNLRVRRARHDISGCLETMKELARSGGDVQGCADHIERALQPIYRIDYCDNRIIDAVLHAKVTRAEELGIAISRLQVVVPKKTGVEDVDLMRVFVNLLDNAVEGCAGAAGKKTIEIECAVAAGGLALRVVNTCAPDAGACSRKKDGFLHGLGLASVREVARRYDGVFEYGAKDGFYNASVYLPTEEARAAQSVAAALAPEEAAL